MTFKMKYEREMTVFSSGNDEGVNVKGQHKILEIFLLMFFIYFYINSNNINAFGFFRVILLKQTVHFSRLMQIGNFRKRLRN